MRIDAPEGVRIAVLFSYIKGKQLSKTPQPKAAGQFGALLARLHLSADQLSHKLPRHQVDFDLLVQQALHAFEKAAGHRPADIADLYHVAGKLKPRIEVLSKAKPEYGLVHGDVIPSNMLVTPAGAPALIDFDFCGYGWRAYDIATFLNEAEYWRLEAAVRREFLEGYQLVRELSRDERSAIPLFEAARNIFSLGIPAQNVDTWGSAYQNDRMIDIHIENMKKNMEALD